MSDKIKLSKENIKVLIENKLYSEVMILVEGHYNQEGVIDNKKKEADRLIFKDKKKVIELVSDSIIEFAKEYNIGVKEVKDYLLKVITDNINLDNIHKLEYTQINNIVSNLSDKYEEK